MTAGTVYVVDDDVRVRDALENLLAAFGFHVVACASAAEYLASAGHREAACLVLDVELPDISGLELQRRLSTALHPPIVFITGHGDIPSSVSAMKAGAVDFLPKPFTPDELLAAINIALERDRKARMNHSEMQILRARLASLTPREREVLPLVVRGLLNKQAAAALGISEITLQIHRGQVMRKMQAESLAELVRMGVKLGIEGSRAGVPGAAIDSSQHQNEAARSSRHGIDAKRTDPV